MGYLPVCFDRYATALGTLHGIQDVRAHLPAGSSTLTFFNLVPHWPDKLCRKPSWDM